MSIERCYSLTKAARIIGVNRETLKIMLMADLNLTLPSIPRGSHNLIPESVLKRLVRKRAPHKVMESTSLVFDGRFA